MGTLFTKNLDFYCVEHDAETQRLISIERKAIWQGEQKPTSTLISVPRLALDWMLFEIDAVIAMHI